MYFEIQANVPEEAVKFYTAIFGWKATKDEHSPIEYWRLETNGIGGAILKRPAPMGGENIGNNAFVCSMEVESFDATAEKIKAHGGKEAFPKFAIPGKCWQGYFLDTQGNSFGIFEVDEKAA